MSPHKSYSKGSSCRLTRGIAAGFIATAPMTAIMLVGRRFLGESKDFLLPPQAITVELAERFDLEERMHPMERDLTALSLHFTYGAVMGSGYALLEPRIPLPPSIKGSLAGLAVWVGSYLGWLPATQMFRPSARHPQRLNILMILAHIAWGVTLGVLFGKLNSTQ